MPRAHATLAALALRASLDDLAEVGSPDDKSVDGGLLEAALVGDVETTEYLKGIRDPLIAKRQALGPEPDPDDPDNPTDEEREAIRNHQDDVAAIDDAHYGMVVDGAEVAGRLAELVTAASAAVGRLQRIVDDANTEVDSYLSRYPALETTEDLAVYALDIAMYRALGGDRESERYVRYDGALRYLRAVAAGDINLDLDEDETDGQTSSRARFSASKSRFKREELAGL